MNKDFKIDNSTFVEKRTLRKKALTYIDSPVVCETHGGYGKLYDACYTNISSGIVLDSDPQCTRVLALQRPSWRVYEGDCEVALTNGLGADMPISLLDVDPYGSSWETIQGFFTSERNFTQRMVLAVNDGLRRKRRIGAWDVKILKPIVEKYGNKLANDYLSICHELLDSIVVNAGYRIDHFAGYYCGHNKQMTHYLAVLKREVPEIATD